MARFSRDRRRRFSQRDAVEQVLAKATGTTRVVPVSDGSVMVYDEVREGPAPGTQRIRVTERGELDPPEFFRFRQSAA